MEKEQKLTVYSTKTSFTNKQLGMIQRQFNQLNDVWFNTKDGYVPYSTVVNTSHEGEVIARYKKNKASGDNTVPKYLEKNLLEKNEEGNYKWVGDKPTTETAKMMLDFFADLKRKSRVRLATERAGAMEKEVAAIETPKDVVKLTPLEEIPNWFIESRDYSNVEVLEFFYKINDIDKDMNPYVLFYNYKDLTEKFQLAEEFINLKNQHNSTENNVEIKQKRFGEIMSSVTNILENQKGTCTSIELKEFKEEILSAFEEAKQDIIVQIKGIREGVVMDAVAEIIERINTKSKDSTHKISVENGREKA